MCIIILVAMASRKKAQGQARKAAKGAKAKAKEAKEQLAAAKEKISAHFFEQHIATHMRKTQPTQMKWQKVQELQEADDHTLVKFLSKLIPCKCLDEKYKEVKSVTKMGTCGYNQYSLFQRQVKRSKMFYCTRCSQVCYCSTHAKKLTGQFTSSLW